MKLNQGGYINRLLVPFAFTLILLVGSFVFGAWAFMSRQDYKNNVDKKIEEASAVAVELAKTSKDSEFVEKEKQPLKDYGGPAAFGSVVIKYPKTWSAYVDESGKSTAAISGTFHPNFVPADRNSLYALRLEVVNRAYTEELKRFDSNVKSGKVSVSAFRAEKVQDVLGSRVDGEIDTNKQGSMILLPLRDKTLKLWTESQQYVGDFNTLVLPNLTFSP